MIIQQQNKIKQNFSYSFLNFYISALRNVFLTSSIAISVLLFSQHFKDANYYVMVVLGVGIMGFSLLIGYKATNDYNSMINYLKIHNRDNKDIFLLLDKLSNWKYFYFGYASFIFIMVILVLSRTHKNISK